MPKRLLITGFDPFGGQSVNPAWEAVSRLPARVGDCVVHALQVPTVFGLAAQRVIEEAQALRPDVILCVGQAGGPRGGHAEMVAINLRYAAIPDNAGLQPQDIPCAEDGRRRTLPPCLCGRWHAPLRRPACPGRRVLHGGHVCVQ